MFLLVPAHPGSPEQRAEKRLYVHSTAMRPNNTSILLHCISLYSIAWSYTAFPANNLHHTNNKRRKKLIILTAVVVFVRSILTQCEISDMHNDIYYVQFISHECFDTVGWASGRAFGL